MRYKRVKKILIFWCLFIGIGAVIGSICMFIDPTGKLLRMDSMLPYFSVLPFSDVLFKNYIFSGLALLIVNGISNLVAVYFLLKDNKLGIILGTIFGFTLMLWISIQFVIFPCNIMSTSYFIFGILQLVAGYITYVFYLQSKFKFNINDYDNMGTNKKVCVVYFSRMGYTKKVAYEIANKEGTDIIELKTKEKTTNTSGFWWCGRFGMHKWNMNIDDLNVNFNKYDNVIIVSPIWVFSICAPVRSFCYKYSSDIKNVQYVFTHFIKANFENVADEVDRILGKRRDKFVSICVRFGEVKKIFKEERI